MNWSDIVKALEQGQYDKLLVLPEFRRLKGIRQISPRHGEDVWRHTCLVIAEARNLSEDPMVWWAAACHDLGKAEGFLSRVLGWHIGHAERSARITQELCDRLQLKEAVTDLAVKTARWHMAVHKAHRADRVRQVEIVQESGALSRPGRLRDILTVCEADARGRDSRIRRPTPEKAGRALTEVLKALRPSVV